MFRHNALWGLRGSSPARPRRAQQANPDPRLVLPGHGTAVGVSVEELAALAARQLPPTRENLARLRSKIASGEWTL